MGSFRLVAGNRHLHRYYNFAGRAVETVPDHYAFHAGQNLPDKEFRYLRTVIVTAAVHWGFNSMLAHLLLTFQHRAGVSSYTSSFDLAQTCVFGKQFAWAYSLRLTLVSTPYSEVTGSTCRVP